MSNILLRVSCCATEKRNTLYPIYYHIYFKTEMNGLKCCEEQEPCIDFKRPHREEPNNYGEMVRFGV